MKNEAVDIKKGSVSEVCDTAPLPSDGDGKNIMHSVIIIEVKILMDLKALAVI